MLTGGLMFCACLAFMAIVGRSCAMLEIVAGYVGWMLVTVYCAKMMARWIMSSLPKQSVSPDNKAVLITGCDSGFGFDLAQRLDQHGFWVFAGCLAADSEGAKELKEVCSSRLHVLSMDVSKYDQVHEAFREVEAQLDGKDLWAIVNNAGVAIFSELEWCSMSVIEHMFNVNVLGAVRVTKAFLPLIRKCRGRVVIVSSVAGHITYPGFLSYSMTKHSLLSFADGLRREMRKWGITVATIEPSMYRTRITRSDVLTGALENSWERTPDPIKEAYGFPYYEAFRGRMQRIVNNARPHIEEVVECLEHAVTDMRPRISYRCAGAADKFRLWLMSLLPVPLLDLLICQLIQPNHRQLSANGKCS